MFTRPFGQSTLPLDYLPVAVGSPWTKHARYFPSARVHSLPNNQHSPGSGRAPGLIFLHGDIDHEQTADLFFHRLVANKRKDECRVPRWPLGCSCLRIRARSICRSLFNNVHTSHDVIVASIIFPKS